MNSLKPGWLTYAVVLILFTTNAYAGAFGKGTGKNSTTVALVVTNSSTNIVGVYYDSTNAAIQTAISDDDPTEFTDAGGVILNPGDTTTFNIKAGTYSFLAVPDDGVGFLPQETATIQISGGSSPTLDLMTNSDGVDILFFP